MATAEATKGSQEAAQRSGKQKTKDPVCRSNGVCNTQQHCNLSKTWPTGKAKYQARLSRRQ
eukprot:90836-Prorocentrum_lima.AAC.1